MHDGNQVIVPNEGTNEETAPSSASRHDDGGFDRAICIHDARYGGIAGPNGGVYESTLGYPAIGEWAHIVATFENGADCKVYLNFAHQDSRVVQNNDGRGDLSIGGLVVDGGQSMAGHSADVSIAAVRVYDRRLTDADVEQRFQVSLRR